MMMDETAFICGIEGFHEAYDSEYEFKRQLKVQVHLESKHFERGRVFWGETGNQTCFGNNNPEREIIKGKIKDILLEFASRSELWKDEYMVQFWAVEVNEQQQVYLTTSDQPFAVGNLYKGMCWYRQLCMGHRYRVDEGAGEDELGGVGRAYRNRRPESTPDLRLYSSKEFPLRDLAAASGLRSYYALPLFDLLSHHCYGVIEVSWFQYEVEDMLSLLEEGLRNAMLRTTHLNFCLPEIRVTVHTEIIRMAEWASMVMPQLQKALVWIPCHQCSNDFTCFQNAFYRDYDTSFPNSYMSDYLKACALHNLQIAGDTNPIARTAMPSINKPRICRNICDLSISENPLAHYTQIAKLSFCFAICVRSLYNSREIYLLQFFLQFNSGEDALVGSFLRKVLSIMERELISFDFAYKGHIGEDLVVEVVKENMISHETFKYKHDDLEDVSMLMVMEGFKEELSVSDFKKDLQEPELQCIELWGVLMGAWIFWSEARADIYENEVINSNLSPVSADTIQEKIKSVMSKVGYEGVAQFWAPKKDDKDRCYLETSGQPFAVSSLSRGLASFRKQCVEHQYYVDDAAKGPPGRVFLNGHPETSPDLRLYTTTEFALRNHAARSSLKRYYALPIFQTKQHHICVGVLEFLICEPSYFSEYSLHNAMKATNLHMNFNPEARGPSDLAGNKVESWALALSELEEVCKYACEIPQVFKKEVWVPNNKCGAATINTSKLTCMERLNFSEYTKLTKFKHVETGKGMTDMALASQNNSCLCLNLSGFSLAEQPLAHDAQATWLDACFAICLKSCHTGDLVYVLEFYLYQAPRRSDYFTSFLCLLLPFLKQKLTSFKVASGQQLGDKLVVEVIQFSQVNEFDVPESDHSDGVPFTFKFVNYRGQKHRETHKHDVRFCPDDGVESVSIDADTQHSGANLNKKEATNGTKNETGLNITFTDLQSHFGKKRKDAAKELCVSESTFKRLCRKYGIQRWPQNEKYKNNPSLFMTENANQSGRDSQPNISSLPNGSNLPPPDMPQTDPKSSQHLITQPNVDMMVIYAKYESKTIKFKLCHTAGMEKLVSEVAMRLKLEVGSFEMEYLDEINEKILLTCDADLELCLESIAAVGKSFVQIFVNNLARMGKPSVQVVPSSTSPSSFAGAYIHHFPAFFHSYIVSIKNVVGDGHCGFRVVADLLGFREDSWPQVRCDLINELILNHELYTSVFIKNGAVEEILHSLQCFEERTSNAHWFTLPEMGYLVASTYNVALVSLSSNMCSTFLPLRTAVPFNWRCICIGLVNNDHFVQVILRDGHPLPPVLAKWRECHYPDAASWCIVCAKQLELYKSIVGNNVNVVPLQENCLIPTAQNPLESAVFPLEFVIPTVIPTEFTPLEKWALEF